ncbi:MAG: hypothetical protein A2Y25_02905 [Candidatus Melainabacteria bacterium GWF2_37_15]|nr:MAG: hypothetical protein A2Y25_02905 [Candidatus Melainabacteria bacterium GWF2_37_15]
MLNINLINLQNKPIYRKPASLERGGVLLAPRLNVLQYDRVCFKGLTLDKLREFPDIYAFASLSKLPLSQYNSPDEIQNHAKEKLEGLFNLNQYKIPDPEHKEASNVRIEKLEEWKQYLTKENILTKDNPALSCIIFSAITKDLKPNNRKPPEVLDKRALADTIGELRKAAENKGRLDFNFINKYKQNLMKGLSGLENKDVSAKAGLMTGWVRIPSKKNDPENFEANVKKMQVLSCETWCTKGDSYARKYLKRGDDHLYIENGKTKLSISFEDDIITEFQDVTNDSIIPLEYLNVVERYIEENKFNKIYPDAKKLIADAEEAILKSGVKNLGSLMTKIYGDAFFENYQVECLGDLKEIVGCADFKDSKVKDLGQLEIIRGAYTKFSDSQITDLKNLKIIGGHANFKNSLVTNLGKLKIINAAALFQDSQIKNLGNLQIIGYTAHFENSQVKDLGKLEYIGGDVYLNENTKDLDFSKVYVKGKFFVPDPDQNSEELYEKYKEIIKPCLNRPEGGVLKC